MLFNGQENALKLPLPLKVSGPYLIHGFFGPHKSAPKWHLDLCSRSCMAHKRDQQTNTQADRPRYSVCSNMQHLAIVA